MESNGSFDRRREWARGGEGEDEAEDAGEESDEAEGGEGGEGVMGGDANMGDAVAVGVAPTGDSAAEVDDDGDAIGAAVEEEEEEEDEDKEGGGATMVKRGTPLPLLLLRTSVSDALSLSVTTSFSSSVVVMRQSVRPNCRCTSRSSASKRGGDGKNTRRTSPPNTSFSFVAAAGARPNDLVIATPRSRWLS